MKRILKYKRFVLYPAFLKFEMKLIPGNKISSIEVDNLLVTVGGQLPGEIRGAYY